MTGHDVKASFQSKQTLTAASESKWQSCRHQNEVLSCLSSAILKAVQQPERLLSKPSSLTFLFAPNNKGGLGTKVKCSAISSVILITTQHSPALVVQRRQDVGLHCIFLKPKTWPNINNKWSSVQFEGLQRHRELNPNGTNPKTKTMPSKQVWFTSLISPFTICCCNSTISPRWSLKVCNLNPISKPSVGRMIDGP